MKRLFAPIIACLLVLAFSVSVYAKDVADVLFNPQGKMAVGKAWNVDVIIDSTTTVNAAQLTIKYPADQFTLQKIDSSNSKFTIAAEEKTAPGTITIAKGNLEPLKGRNLLATLVVTPLKSTASVNNLSITTSDSLVMSTQNVNILSGSKVLTQKPYTTPAPPKKDSGFISLIKKTFSEFFGGLFGKK